jgi:hypothetical protein
VSEAKKNDAPSAEAIKFADWALAYFVCVDQDTRYTFVSKVDDLLARVRREARAEAFEEMARYADGARLQSDGDSDFIVHSIKSLALAAKERAK